MRNTLFTGITASCSCPKSFILFVRSYMWEWVLPQLHCLESFYLPSGFGLVFGVFFIARSKGMEATVTRTGTKPTCRTPTSSGISQRMELQDWVPPTFPCVAELRHERIGIIFLELTSGTTILAMYEIGIEKPSGLRA